MYGKHAKHWIQTDCKHVYPLCVCAIILTNGFTLNAVDFRHKKSVSLKRIECTSIWWTQQTTHKNYDFLPMIGERKWRLILMLVNERTISCVSDHRIEVHSFCDKKCLLCDSFWMQEKNFHINYGSLNCIELHLKWSECGFKRMLFSPLKNVNNEQNLFIFKHLINKRMNECWDEMLFNADDDEDHVRKNHRHSHDSTF